MTTLTLPGLIDVHTHLRVPGGEHKEDFATGTAAALAGGITMVLGMPNTSPAIINEEVMQQARTLAARDAYCDVGLYVGASKEGLGGLGKVAPISAAMKIYLNDTFGLLRVDEVPTLAGAFKEWPEEKMIAMHAEKQSVAVGIGLAATYNRRVHFCHISRREEIELIADAKARGLPVTCEVTPHHLFMSEEDYQRLGPLADMRPVLGTASDVAALWEHINTTIDCIATDHAPHTLEEKHSATPPPGVVGLETSLPLMLTAVEQGKITLERVIEMMYTNPKRIFSLPDQENTEVHVELARSTIRNADLHTKCGWTPFDGREVAARVRRVILRGEVAYEDGKVMVPRGFGRLIPA